MTKRALVLTVAGLAAAGALAGVRYSSRGPEATDPDHREAEELSHEIEEFGEGFGKLGKGLHRMGKGLARAGKGLRRLEGGTTKDQ